MTIKYLDSKRISALSTDTPTETTSNITWSTTGKVGYNISGTTISRTGSDGWSLSKIQSEDTFTVGDGTFMIEFSGGGASTNSTQLGFNKGTLGYHHGSGSPQNSCDFAIYMAGGDQIEVYESGTKSYGSGGARSASDKYRIEINNDGLVKYYLQAGGTGSWVLKYTSSITASGTYFIQANSYASTSVVTVHSKTVTTVVKPTNVQDNSILVEKDTGRRYWFDDEFSKTGLKAYYKFDESSGDIINQATSVGSTDSLGSDADIQITGATYSQTGKIATALSFDGINDYGVIGTSTSQFNFLHSTTAKWTICFWMKLVASSRGTFDRIFNTTVSSGTAGINIYLNDLSSTQKMGFVIHNSTSGQGVCDWVSTANDYIPDDTNTWHFYSLTYDQSLGSNNFKIKRDNDNLEQQTKTSNSPVNTNSTYVMHLNRLPSGSGNFPANLIDDFSVWNRVLTDDEISTLYNAGTGKTVDTANLWQEIGT